MDTRRESVTKSPKVQERNRTPQADARQSQVAAAHNRDERIRQRAYELFEARTRAGSPGSDLTDWLQAENEVRKH